MITETEAREMLARAAGTIEAPSGELVLAPRQRPRWIAPVAAAAAIAAAVATGLVLIDHQDREDRSGPVAPTPSPTVDPYAGSVPPVFAYDADSARQMLEDRGLRVTRKVVTNRCQAPGRALRTKPIVGSPVGKGDQVTLYVSGPLVNSCFPRDLAAWQILDFANGRGPAPSWAPKVAFYLNGRVSDQRDTLAAMAALTRQYSSWGTPPLRVTRQEPPTTNEVNAVPEGYAGREALTISIASPTTGIYSWCECAQVLYDKHDHIDAIVAWISADVTDPPELRQESAYRGVARRFIGFALRQIRHPGFGEHVGLYRGGHKVAVLGQQRAGDRAAYQECPGEAQPDQCGLSPIDLLRRMRGTPSISLRGGCFQFAAGRLRNVSPRLALITEPGVSPCESSWVIEVEYNDVGQIIAVNEFSGPN